MGQNHLFLATRQGRYRSLLKEAAGERLVRERVASSTSFQTRRAVAVRDLRKLAELLVYLQANEAPISGWTLNLAIYQSTI